MATQGEPEPRIIIDEDWKARVEAEKEQLRRQEAQGQRATAAAASKSEQAAFHLPPASFPVLVEWIATQALAVIADAMSQDKEKPPSQKLPEPARPMVRHFIDLLSVLEEKTQGNLSPDESQHLSRRLHELRMTYIELT